MLKPVSQLIFITLLSAALFACGGGGGGGGNTPASYSVSGSVNGLTNTGLVLQNNNSDDLAISADGNFTFLTTVGDLSGYSVTVSSQPLRQTCIVTNGSGTVAGSNINDIVISCGPLTAIPTVLPMSKTVTLTWADVGATSYNLYYSSDKNFNPDNYSMQTDGTLITNVSSPVTVTGLNNGTAYYFILETVNSNSQPRSPEVAARPNTLAFNGSVFTQGRGSDGTLYLGGVFTHVGTVTGSGVALNKQTGRVANGDFSIIEGRVNVVISDGAGGWYIGGRFTRLGNRAVQTAVAHVLADGSVDETWQPGISGDVNDMKLANNIIYVGGSLFVNNQFRSLVAVGTDGVLTSWSPMSSGSVQTLLVAGDVIYVGGSFTSIDGLARNRLAAIGTDGALLDWDPNVECNVSFCRVYSLAFDGASVYIGGSFASVSGVVRNNLASVGVDGILSNWNPDVTCTRAPCYVYSLALNGSTLYAGGSYNRVGGVTRSGLSAIGIDGVLTDWDPGLGAKSLKTITSLVIENDTAFVAGYFEYIGGAARSNLAALSLTSANALDWNPGSSGWTASLALGVNNIFVGGAFNSVGGVQRNRLAAIASDGSLSSWNPDANGSVAALDVADDTIYVGGRFSRINGMSRGTLAAIGTDGVVTSWNPNQGFVVTTGVNQIKVFLNNVYIGGDFSLVGGLTRNYLASIGTDGVVTSWDPNPDGQIYELDVMSNVVYVSGAFTTIGGVARNNLAAVLVGGAMTGWDPNPNGPIYDIEATPSIIYLGGAFTTMGGIARNRLAAVTTASTNGVLLDWSPSVNGGSVSTITSAGSTIYVGGQFSTVDGTRRNGLASIETNGVLNAWDPTGNGGGQGGGVYADISTTGSIVYVVGNFSQIGGRPTSNFARFDVSGTLLP